MRASIDNFYSYIYYDPSRNNEPIYVGKGYRYRAWAHLKLRNNVIFIRRLKKMKRNGIKPIIGIINCKDEEEAFSYEMWFIYKFGRKDLNKGSLLNLTDGGEGVSGNIATSVKNRNLLLSSKGIHPWQLSNNNSVRVSCLACKKEVNWPVYCYAHGENCKELHPQIEIKLPGQGFKAGHASRAGKIGGIAGGKYAKENKTGIHSMSEEKEMIRKFNSMTTHAINSGKACQTIYPSVKEWSQLAITQ